MGGMERLNQHIALELAAKVSLGVVGPPGCRASMPRGVDVLETGSARLGRFLLGATLEGLRSTFCRRFDWVLAGSGVTAPIAWIASRLSRARYAVYLHGLDIVVPHPIYRRLWLPLIRRVDLCLVNSRNTAELAVRAGVPAQRIRVLHPGVELTSPKAPAAAAAWRERYGLAGKKVMLSVGRLTRRKGLLEFVELSTPAIVAEDPRAVLLVIGNEAPDALVGNAQGISSEIRQAASRQGLEDHLILLGPSNEADLEAAYEGADVLVFPVRSLPHDVEGFGMVAVEAATHGLPTVAFSVGGVSDAVETGVSGWLVEPGDYAAFAGRINDVLSPKASPVTPESCRRFSERFAWPLFGQRLLDHLGIARSR